MGYKNLGQQTFWDSTQKSKATRLDELAKHIDFELFKPHLEKAFPPHQLGQGKYHPLVLFKMMLLQKWHDLSDRAVEDNVIDRISFRRFLGLSAQDPVPDSTSLGNFRKALREKGLLEELFALLSAHLQEQGLLVNSGTLVDVTFVSAPISKDRDGDWRDTDADFGHKGHGYSLATNVDKETKFVVKTAFGSARPHDSQYFKPVLTGQEKELWADSAFAHFEQELQEAGVTAHLNEKAYRNKPLTDTQKERNREKSKVRSRVEHPYAVLKENQGFRRVRYLGLLANQADALMHVIAYNLQRMSFLIRSKPHQKQPA